MKGPRPFWRRRLLPAFVALLSVNLIVLVAWTAPRALRLRNATARVETTREAAERERERARRLRERSETIQANAEDLARLYESVLGAEGTHLLPTLEEIEGMARAPGLTPGPRRFRREEVEGVPVERVVIVLPLQGSYQQLVGFLQQVERSPRFLTVDRVALRGGEGVEAALQVEMSAYMRLASSVPAGERRGGAQ